ncbi:MAG: hypothetical protein ACK5LN_12320 [Propioniciclava sp.]
MQSHALRHVLLATSVALVLTACTPDGTSPSTAPAVTVDTNNQTPTPAAATHLPADSGTLPDGFTLPHENDPATDDRGAWEPADWSLSCLDSTFPIAVLNQLTGSRIRGSEIPEGFDSEGLLQFGSDTDAQTFMTEVEAGFADCTTTGEPGPDNFRGRMAASTTDGPGDSTFAVREWREYSEDGETWVESPGGSISLITQQGPNIAITQQSGEFLGDALDAVSADDPLFTVASEILGSV